MQVRAGLEQEPLLGQSTDDLVSRVTGREPVQPAIRVVETARLVHRREHREVVEEAELEVLLAGARCDVDDAGSLLERDLVPRDDPVVDLAARAEVVERTAVAKTHELFSAGPMVGIARRDTCATATHSPFSRRPYSASGLTAAATFAGNVQGVVVQTTRDSFGRSRSGKRT